MFVKSVIFLDL